MKDPRKLEDCELPEWLQREEDLQRDDRLPNRLAAAILGIWLAAMIAAGFAACSASDGPEPRKIEATP